LFAQKTIFFLLFLISQEIAGRMDVMSAAGEEVVEYWFFENAILY
jgi:hypothetical protein